MSKVKDTCDLGRIKYWPLDDPTDIHFGDVERYSDEAKTFWKTRRILVEDAVTGERFLESLDMIGHEKQPYGHDNWDKETNMPIDTEYDRHINDAYKDHIKKSKEAGEGMVKNKLFSIPIADGCAWYVITKVKKKTVDIEWRGFCLDQWYDPTLNYGGSFPHNCIQQHAEWADVRERNFA